MLFITFVFPWNRCQQKRMEVRFWEGFLVPLWLGFNPKCPLFCREASSLDVSMRYYCYLFLAWRCTCKSTNDILLHPGVVVLIFTLSCFEQSRGFLTLPPKMWWLWWPLLVLLHLPGVLEMPFSALLCSRSRCPSQLSSRCPSQLSSARNRNRGALLGSPLLQLLDWNFEEGKCNSLNSNSNSNEKSEAF